MFRDFIDPTRFAHKSAYVKEAKTEQDFVADNRGKRVSANSRHGPSPCLILMNYLFTSGEKEKQRTYGRWRWIDDTVSAAISKEKISDYLYSAERFRWRLLSCYMKQWSVCSRQLTIGLFISLDAAIERDPLHFYSAVLSKGDDNLLQLTLKVWKRNKARMFCVQWGSCFVFLIHSNTYKSTHLAVVTPSYVHTSMEKYRHTKAPKYLVDYKTHWTSKIAFTAFISEVLLCSRNLWVGRGSSQLKRCVWILPRLSTVLSFTWKQKKKLAEIELSENSRETHTN